MIRKIEEMTIGNKVGFCFGLFIFIVGCSFFIVLDLKVLSRFNNSETIVTKGVIADIYNVKRKLVIRYSFSDFKGNKLSSTNRHYDFLNHGSLKIGEAIRVIYIKNNPEDCRMFIRGRVDTGLHFSIPLLTVFIVLEIIYIDSLIRHVQRGWYD